MDPWWWLWQSPYWYPKSKFVKVCIHFFNSFDEYFANFNFGNKTRINSTKCWEPYLLHSKLKFAYLPLLSSKLVPTVLYWSHLILTRPFWILKCWIRTFFLSTAILIASFLCIAHSFIIKHFHVKNLLYCNIFRLKFKFQHNFHFF